MNRKTIAFVIQSLNSGGAERVVSILTGELVKKYHVVIIMNARSDPFYPIHPEVKIVHCLEEVAPSSNFLQAIRQNYRLVKMMWKHLNKNKVDVCIAFITSTNILAIIASRLAKIPIIISERNYPGIEDLQVPALWKWLRRLTYPMANMLVVQTQAIKEYYLPKIKEEKIAVIPNPINPDFNSTVAGGRQNVVLNVGRLADQKAQDLLIRAFAQLKPSGWKLHIVGEGNNRSRLEELIAELKMNDCIELKGKSTDIERYYLGSKIFAFTSIFEGFPNALLEAMHFGLACVSTNCPTGPSDLIEDGVNGYLIPVNDQAALEKKLQQLMLNEKERIRFGLAARKSADRFRVEKVVKEWESLLTRVSG